MNREKMITSFERAMKEMGQDKTLGTYVWKLDEDDNGNQWAIVLGWRNVGEEDLENEYADGTYWPFAKLAYQPSNSIMQCDYDIDWLMPYDEETKEVDDNEIAVNQDTSAKEVVDTLLEYYQEYRDRAERELE